MDIVTLAVAKSYTDEAIAGIGGGITYKGAVDYYSSLPSNASAGDAYTVKYKGSSGTDPDGSEYVWGNYEGTNQWIKLGSDSSEDILVVVYSGYPSDITCNQSYETIRDAIINNLPIVGWVAGETISLAETRLRQIQYFELSPSGLIRAYCIVQGSGFGAITHGFITHDALNSIQFSSMSEMVMPTASAADRIPVSKNVLGQYVWNSSSLKTVNSQSLIGSGNIDTEPMTEITWSDLKSLRDSNGLIQGMFYRITDYVTKIIGIYDLSSIGAQGYLHWGKSAEHPFDIIVQAVDDHTLSENARATLHSGDTYFQGADIDAWELKYCLDNDAKAPDGVYPRFGFSDTVNGKGVIYWMKDEWNNQAGYDFKNVQFIRYALKLADTQGSYEPQSTGLDYNPAGDLYSRYGSFYHILIALQSYMDAGTYVSPFKQKAVVDGVVTDVNNYDFYVGYNILGTIQFPTVDASYLTTFNAEWYYTFDYYDVGNSIHYDASFNQFSRVPCRENYLEIESDPVMALVESNFTVIGIGSITWETDSVFVSSLSGSRWASCIGNKLSMHNWANTFGNDCYSNAFGHNCYSNTFGYNCNNNTFGSSCNNNTFGYDCQNNTFGNYCDSNTFGNSCHRNTFSTDYDSNTFGNSCTSNTFGDGCTSNTFGDGCDNNRFQGRFSHIIAGDGIRSVTFPQSMQDSRYMKEIYNYDTNQTGYATFITHTGYNQETAVSTTDHGMTWN